MTQEKNNAKSQGRKDAKGLGLFLFTRLAFFALSSLRGFAPLQFVVGNQTH